MLLGLGVIVSEDTFGPVSDNAQGIAEMSGDVEGEGAAVLTRLDAVGNSTKAITKGIAIATAVLAATALFGAFRDALQGHKQNPDDRIAVLKMAVKAADISRSGTRTSVTVCTPLASVRKAPVVVIIIGESPTLPPILTAGITGIIPRPGPVTARSRALDVPTKAPLSSMIRLVLARTPPAV